MAVCIIFSFMAYFYTYNDPSAIEAQFKKVHDDDDEDDKNKSQKTELNSFKKDSIKSHESQTKM